MARRSVHSDHKKVKVIVDKAVYNDAELKAYVQLKNRTCPAQNKHRLQASYGEGEPHRCGYMTLICMSKKGSPTCSGTRQRPSEVQLTTVQQNALVAKLLDEGFTEYLYGPSTVTQRHDGSTDARRPVVAPESSILRSLESKKDSLLRERRTAEAGVKDSQRSLNDYTERGAVLASETEAMRQKMRDLKRREGEAWEELMRSDIEDKDSDEKYDELRINVARITRQLKRCEVELGNLETAEDIAACRISMGEVDVNDAKERLRKTRATYRKWQIDVKRMRENPIPDNLEDEYFPDLDGLLTEVGTERNSLQEPTSSQTIPSPAKHRKRSRKADEEDCSALKRVRTGF